MYPPGEALATIPSVAFLNALKDINMLVPTGPSGDATGPLFPPDRYEILLGGDAEIFGSEDMLTLPLPKIYIAVGRSYGSEQGYAGDTYVDLVVHIPFSVYAMTGGTQDDVQPLLEFSRNHRSNVYSSYGLGIISRGNIRARPRPNSPITGLVITDYAWQFFYSRS